MRLFIMSPKGDFEAIVAAEAELDGAFDAIDVETGEHISVQGWACDIEALDEPDDGPAIPPELLTWNQMTPDARARLMARVGERKTLQLWLRACLAEVKAGRHVDA
jgi:hypothetical protein